MKKWYLSRTLWFNAVTLALGILSVASQTFPLPPEYLALANGVGNVILRFLTSQPLTFGQKSL